MFTRVIADDGAEGFVVPTTLATSLIFGMKGVPVHTVLSAKRPSSSHITPLSEHLDLGRFTYILAYIMAALMTASLHDSLPSGVDEKTAKGERERAVKRWSEHPEWALRAMFLHIRGKMNEWERTVTGIQTTHWLTTAAPAVVPEVWPGEALHWMTSEGREQYGYLSWERTEPRRSEKLVVPCNIVPGQPLPEFPIF